MRSAQVGGVAGVIRERYLSLVVLIGLATASACMMTVQAAIALIHEGQAAPWIGLLRARIADCFCYAIFVPFLCWLAWRYPIDRARWATSLPLYFVVALIIAFAKEALFVATGDFFRPGVFVLWDILAEDYGSEVLNIWALTGIAHALAFHERYWAALRENAQVDAIEHLAVLSASVVHRVRLDEIEWIEAQGNYSRLNARGRRHLIRETMGSLEQRLGERFIRVHRSIIVNTESIARVETRAHSDYWLVLRSGAHVPTGRSYKDKIRPLLP